MQLLKNFRIQVEFFSSQSYAQVLAIFIGTYHLAHFHMVSATGTTFWRFWFLISLFSSLVPLLFLIGVFDKRGHFSMNFTLIELFHNCNC